MKVILNVIAGPHRGRSFEFQEHDTFIVGRARYAHFRLANRDQHLSRAHFLVEANPPLCRVTDMVSTNGTFLNGRRIDESLLQDGDVIEAGDASIAVRIDETGDPRATRQAAGSNPVPISGSDRESSISLPINVEEPIPTTIRNVNAGAGADDIPGYHIVRELGRGGMGTVFLAERESDGIPVAVKVIQPAVPVGPAEIPKFLREAAILTKLSHDRIVRFFDCGQANGAVFLVMEYVDGFDAAAILKQQGPFSVDASVSVICQVLEALQYAHQCGFIHRDIKPANILLVERDGQWQTKLADFGLARVYQSSKLSGLTLQGEFGGSLPFIPPEQITDFRNVDPRADIYSAAATFYTLLSGEFVHDFAKSFNKRILQVLEGNPVPLEQRRPDLPAALVRLVHRGLSRDPEDRFPSADQMRRSLLPFAEQRD